MSKITPFLWFEKDAEKAAKFYVSVFSRSKIVKVRKWGPGSPFKEGSVMAVDFRIEGRDFVAFNGGKGPAFTDAVSLFVDCKDQKEVDRLWKKLTSNGGQAGPCGWCKDRWGLSWQIVPDVLFKLFQDKDKGRASRAMQAMMKMGKLDIKALQAAADGK